METPKPAGLVKRTLAPARHVGNGLGLLAVVVLSIAVENDLLIVSSATMGLVAVAFTAAGNQLAGWFKR